MCEQLSSIPQQTIDRDSVLVEQEGKHLYLMAWSDQADVQRLVRSVFTMTGIPIFEMPEAVRYCDTTVDYFINYDNNPQQVKGKSLGSDSVLIR